MELRPYQERAIEFWLKHKKVYLAIDMGLGKTAIALHLINQMGLRALVVSPLKVTYNTWPDEIKDWDLQGDISIDILHGPDKDEKFKRQSQVHAINYEGLPWLYKRLYKLHQANKPMPYKVLVLDESTCIKSYDSDRFGYIAAMRDMFTYIANLSGTPAPNSLLDLWAQYYILDKGNALGNSYPAFKTKYFEQDPYRKYNWTLRFGAEKAIHKAIAPRTFRLSADDYIKLPKRVFNRIGLDLLPKEKEMYESFRKDFILFLDSADIKSFNKASLSSKLRQFIQGSVYDTGDDGVRTTHYVHSTKIHALKRLLEDLSGRNVLCLIQFKFEIEMLSKSFPNVPFITGSSKNSESNLYIKQWQQGKLPLLFAHPKSVGRGLNLQSGGNIIVWLALPWSLDDYLQTNKRLHRPGQKEVVLIYHMIMNNTIDETVFNALNEKEMTQAKLLEYLRQKTKETLNE